jgi:hypothetical protein
MDPTQARRLRIARRAEGMRRQRRVTQVSAAGAVVAAVAFGWAFAHPATAGAETSDSTQSPAGTGGGTGQQSTGGVGQQSTGGDDTLQQSGQAPGPAAADQAPGRQVQPDLQSGGS